MAVTVLTIILRHVSCAIW